MLRRIIISLFVISIVSSSLFAQKGNSYKALWDDVGRNGSMLPQSALVAVDRILVKAQAENNRAQFIRGCVARISFRQEIAPDSFAVDVRDFRKMAEKETSPVARAVFYAILSGSSSDKADIMEAMADVEALGNARVADWLPVVYSKGNASVYFSNDMLSLVGFYVIPHADAKTRRTLLDKMLSYYRSAGNRPAQLLVERSMAERKDESHILPLIERYSDLPLCGLLYESLARYEYEKKNLVSALRYARQGIKLCPKYEGIGNLRNIEAEILMPSCRLEMPEQIYPLQTRNISVYARNLSQVTLRVYRLSRSVLSDNNSLTDKFIKKYGTLVSQNAYSITNKSDYTQSENSITIGVPHPGLYVYELSAVGCKTPVRTLVSVSRLTYYAIAQPGKKTEFRIVNSISGNPVAGARMRFLKRTTSGYKVNDVVAANRDGFLTGSSQWTNLQPIVEDDSASVVHSSNLYFNSVSEDEWKVRHTLFTDRSIYRPGQVVQASVVSHKICGDSLRVNAGENIKFTLYDSRNRKVADTLCTSDAFGVASCSFTLPTDALSGSFQLGTGHSSSSFSVEEYKRPAFSVEFDVPEEQYASGDTLSLRGVVRSLSGVPMADVDVRCMVTNSRSRNIWGLGDKTLLDSLVVRTLADGSFVVPVVIPFAGKKDNYRRNVCIVEASVVSGMGETREASISLPYGPERVSITASVPEVVLRENPLPITLTVANSAGQALNDSVNYALYTADKVKGKWVGRQFVKQGTMPVSSTSLPYPVLDTPPGNYMIYFRHPSDSLTADSAKFVLMSSSDSYAVAGEPLLFTSLYDEITADKLPTFFVASDTIANVVVNVFSGNKRIMQQICRLRGTVSMLEISNLSRIDRTLTAVCCMQSNGKFYSRTIKLSTPLPDKHLDYEWTSFRNRLEPGQRERWTLRVSRDGAPVSANILATMYDASLDNLRPHQWNFSSGLRRTFSNAFVDALQLETLYEDAYFPLPKFKTYYVGHGSIVDFHSSFYSSSPIVVGYGKLGTPRKSAVATFAPLMVKRNEETLSYDQLEVRELAAESEPEDVPSQPLRTNFSETAFFFPMLRTDAQGVATMEFTLPESLTSWHLRGFGHTAEMDNFLVDQTVVARKDFTVQPNLPRFFRIGDVASVPYTVSNLGSKSVSGKVRLEVFDLMSERILVSASASFSVANGAQSSGALSFRVPEGDGAVGVRIVASGGKFSDGEQRAVALLPSSQVVVETIPLTVTGEGSEQFSLSKLFANHSQSASKRSLTVEFTSNPVWLAVQALPSIADYQDESCVSLAAAYYANSVAEHIVATNPRIAEVVSMWRSAEPSQRSRLLQNEELRTILLSETPWVLDARDESEQMNAVASLFDAQLMARRRADVIERLRQLQLSDGSFSWFKGMNGSVYLTRLVAEMLARVTSLAGTTEAEPIFARALSFLDGVAEEEYRDIKKNGLKDAPSEFACHYAYICAIASRLEKARGERVRKFLSLVVSNPRATTIYGKGAAAAAMARCGMDKEAKLFAKSLLEYTVATKELGRYYDTKNATLTSVNYRVPSQIMAIEALSLVAPERSAEIMQMKQWLVQQKRTCAWEDVVCSANAVHALLLGSPQLLAEVRPARLTVDGVELPHTSTSDLGYSKNVLTDSRFVSAPRTLVVESNNEFCSFGGVYAKYEQPLSALTDAEGGLSLSLRWQKVSTVGGREVVEPVFAADGRQIVALHVGDKLRATIDFAARQDMEYVQLSLLRPSCAEPRTVLSGYRFSGSLWHYAVTRDASSRFFIDRMPKGSHSLSTDFTVDRTGTYESGNASIQCAYATEFAAHTRSFRFVVK